jgi:hypothetical protein
MTLLEEREYIMSNSYIIEDLEFEVMPGGCSEPVIHWPAARVFVAIVAIFIH